MALHAPTGEWDGTGWEGRQEAERAIALLMSPGGWHEVTTIPSRAASVGWFAGGDVEAIVRHAARCDRKAWEKGVYMTLNPAKEGLGMANARDEHIGCRQWLFLDFDAHAAKEANSTDAEKSAAEASALSCREWLAGQGWPLPVEVDSGNGRYLLYRLAAIPADAVSREFVHRATQAIGAHVGIAVDRKVTNAARICRLPGTLNRRGPDEPGRPQRRCRLAVVPAQVEAVPWELVQAMAGPEPQKKAKKKASGLHASTGSARGKGYGEAAFLAELAAVRGATEGSRNNQCNASAFALYQLVAGGLLDETRVTDALRLAALGTGLGEKEVEATLRSAREAGFKEPRTAPEKEPAGAKAEEPKQDAAQEEDEDWEVVYPASSVTPRRVDWLWRDRVPLGKLTTFAGVGGLGKTFILLDMTARVSTGLPWPDDGDAAEPREPGKVLFISGEDEPDDTLVPRLIALGGDLSRVFFLSDKAMSQFTLANLPLLDRGLEQAGEGVRLVVIDPPTAFLGGVDDHSNAELRGLLGPMSRWAARHKASVIFNTHVNKGGAGKVEAMMRVMGSVAWINAVRAAWMIVRDPDARERRLFLGLKNNLGRERLGLAYCLEADGEMARVKWLGDVETTADEAISSTKKQKREEAAAE